MSNYRRHVLMFVAFMSCLLLDIGSKSWAHHYLLPGDRQIFIPGLVNFNLVSNTGFAFSLGQGQPSVAKAVSLIIFLILVFFYSKRYLYPMAFQDAFMSNKVDETQTKESENDQKPSVGADVNPPLRSDNHQPVVTRLVETSRQKWTSSYRPLQPSIPWLEQLGMSIVIGSAAGNLLERLVHGKVTDFFEFAFINFPVFNVADALIDTGIVLLLISAYAAKK